jgi:glycosyltransferase involved in cell wall biosynthesis
MGMMYLAPEIRSGLGEDTFWTWMAREFPRASFDVPAELGERDALLQYSTLGPARARGGKKVALLWELHPEMAEQGIRGDHAQVLARIAGCAAASDYRVIASPIMAPFYAQFGVLHILPIGVDGDLFRPRDKAAMREKLGLPEGKRLGFWSGTTHEMKGFDRVKAYAAENPNVHLVVAWKKARSAGHLAGHTNVTSVAQERLAELMCACDFLLVAGRLRPFFMVEYEAMACDLPVVNISGLPKDFEPSEHPRQDLEARGWLRSKAKGRWRAFLEDTVGVVP